MTCLKRRIQSRPFSLSATKRETSSRSARVSNTQAVSGKSSFKTFLYAIGRNLALDRLRREKRRRTVPLESAENLAALQSAEEAYLKEESERNLHRAMQKLKEADREVLYLRYFEALPPGEIAALLHKRKKQVESRLYHAKQALKAILEQEEAL